MGFFYTSLCDLYKASPHPQVLAIFLLAAEGGHTAARLQSLSLESSLGFAAIITRSDISSALIYSYSANCHVATNQT